MTTPYDPAASFSPARYAKGMVAVRCPANGTGFKTRAARLACYFSRHRYSGRENAYIMSHAASLKMQKHYAEGFDASVMDRSLIDPRVKS